MIPFITPAPDGSCSCGTATDRSASTKKNMNYGCGLSRLSYFQDFYNEDVSPDSLESFAEHRENTDDHRVEVENRRKHGRGRLASSINNV